MAYRDDVRTLLHASGVSLQRICQLADDAEASYAPPNFQVECEKASHEVQWSPEYRAWQPVSPEGLDDPDLSKLLYDTIHDNLRVNRLGNILRDDITNLGIALLTRSIRNRRYFYVEIEDKKFFLKNLQSKIFRHGVEEFQYTLKAQKVFKDFPFAQVAQPVFGYQQGNTSWYMTEWKDLSAMSGYIPCDTITSHDEDRLYYNESLERVRTHFSQKQRQIFNERYEELAKAASDAHFHDFMGNIDFHPESGTFYLYDF